MAEKKWSNYWGKYKSPSKPKTYKIKPKKGERPTIRISPKIPKFSTPKIGANLNIPVILTAVLALGVLGLGFWQFQSARTIEVMSGEKTDLECQLGNCTEQLQTVNASLVTCNSNLGTCNSGLNKKIIDLNSCTSEKSDINADYKNCKDDLLQYKRDYDNVKDDYDDCKSDLNKKKDDYDEKVDDYNDLKGHYKSLCDSHCSTSCTFNEGNQEYTCVTTTTTTISTTTTT